MIHIALLALFWPVLAVVLEAMVQSPALSRHFVPKDPLPPELVLPLDADVQAETERTATLDKSKQIIFVQNLRRVYRTPNTLVFVIGGLLLLGDAALFFVHL